MLPLVLVLFVIISPLFECLVIPARKMLSEASDGSGIEYLQSPPSPSLDGDQIRDLEGEDCHNNK